MYRQNNVKASVNPLLNIFDKGLETFSHYLGWFDTLFVNVRKVFSQMTFDIKITSTYKKWLFVIYKTDYRI